MWLLNATTHRLHRFAVTKIPPYAILSHRWEETEVTFDRLRDCNLVADEVAAYYTDEEELFPQIRKLRGYYRQKLESIPGWNKIINLCKKTLEHHLNWAWIDTICIDKSSSAELQESINSMYKWYRNASVCFVYMSDVLADGRTWTPIDSVGLQYSHPVFQQFEKSAWFRRGWTLQELLGAPPQATVFFNRFWRLIGTHSQLVDHIRQITGISSAILTESVASIRQLKLSNTSIAERMSWTLHRFVTREEDAAYSLLGIFGVNMPLIYGEGGVKAFYRLQEEIIKTTPDESIFSWGLMEYSSLDLSIEPRRHERKHELLAPSPKYFAHLSEVYCAQHLWPLPRTFQVSQDCLIINASVAKQEDNVIVPDLRRSWLSQALYETTDWRSAFAMPLRCAYSDATTGEADSEEKTICLQLDSTESFDKNIFVQAGPPFAAKVEWKALQEKFEPREIRVLSCRSLAVHLGE